MIRLQRIGRKNEPHFRLVLTEKTTSPRGKYIEALGFVNPKSKERSLEKERVSYWISKGAQVSDTARNLLISEKVLEGKKTPKHKTPKKSEEKK